MYYSVYHFFLTRQAEHTHCFAIGIFSSREKARAAAKELSRKPGFSQRPRAFYILPAFRLRRPKLLDRVFWGDGFESYTYIKK